MPKHARRALLGEADHLFPSFRLAVLTYTQIRGDGIEGVSAIVTGTMVTTNVNSGIDVDGLVVGKKATGNPRTA